MVGKDGEQLTLSKWDDEAWGELVRGGSAPLLARCLEIFGVQEEHPHLALECFASPVQTYLVVPAADSLDAWWIQSRGRETAYLYPRINVTAHARPAA